MGEGRNECKFLLLNTSTLLLDRVSRNRILLVKFCTNFICASFPDFSISFDPRTRNTIWSLLIGSSINSIATYGFDQTLIQRYMCVRSTRGAKQALFISAACSAIIILLSGLIGIILYAYYADCDPYTAKKIDDMDQIFPYFVMEVLGDKKGLPGVFLSCIFAGTLSSISSGLNSLTAVLIEDFYKGLMGRRLTDQREGVLSKIVSVVLGVFVILLTYVVSYFGSILNAAISLSGALSGPIMGVFILGLFFPQANRRGALIGFLASLSLLLWMFCGAQITKNQRIDESLPLSIENCPSNSNHTLEEMMSNWTTTSKALSSMK
jgi:sodium-dependent multivitamin transporter 6